MTITRIGCVVFVSVFIGCGAPPPAQEPTAATPAATASAAAAPSAAPPATATASMFDLQMKSLRDYVHAYNRHDAKAIAALYAEEGALMERGETGASGSGAVTADFQTFFDAFPDCTTAITRSWHRGSSVVFEYVEGGTNTGTHKAHKPSGKKIGYMGASVLVFRDDGKIKLDTTYSDELTREVQAGWAPSSLAKIEVRPIVPVPAPSDTWEVHQAKDSEAEQQKVVATRKGLYSSFSMRSEKDFLATLSDQVALYPYDDPADAIGKTQAARLFKTWTTTFSDGVLAANEAWAVDGHVIVMGTFTGKQTGAWGPVKPTNKTFKTTFLDITRVDKDGKIDRMWTYANNYELLLNLGYHKVQVAEDLPGDPMAVW